MVKPLLKVPSTIVERLLKIVEWLLNVCWTIVKQLLNDW